MTDKQPHPYDMAREQVEQFLADTRAWVDQAQRAENAAAAAAGRPARTARIQYLPGLRSVKCTFLPEEPQHEPPPYPVRRESDAEKIVRLERQLKRARRKAARANEELFSTKISLQNMTGRAAWAERSAAWWKEETTRDFYKKDKIVREGPVEHVITVCIHGGEAPA